MKRTLTQPRGGGIATLALVLVMTALLWGAEVKDPGVRAGAPGAGAPLAGAEMAYFTDGRNTFQKVYSVTGLPDEARGLGPRFNGTSCAGCHSQPAVGGSSPHSNPQLAMAKAHGARNQIPPFLKPDGPVRIVRLKSRPGNVREGEVSRLFTITGRPDAGGCILSQPDFSDTNNMTFRIPTPTFGAGLIENIPDRAILANQRANARAKQELGIGGKPNRDGAGAIARFGWKAQISSLLAFAAEAYAVELGFSDEVLSYGGDSSLPSACVAVRYPSAARYTSDEIDGYEQSYWEPPANVVRVANFMRFLDQPKAVPFFPGATAPSITRGRQLFDTVGCALCHTPALRTGDASGFPAVNHVTAHLYSDLLVHHMGPGLADGIIQGAAGADEFRTAPLWGVGQRVFFLHDGRTSDLLRAIREHKSGQGASQSEANAVIDRFNARRPAEQQDILNFLRSL